MEITVGQVWKDKDKRMNGRHVKVTAVDVLNAWAVWCMPDGSEERGKPRRYAHHTLRAKFELVASPDAPDLTTQLYRLIALAKEHGYLDAAGWISNNMPRATSDRGTQVMTRLNWIKNYRNEKGSTLREAMDAYEAQV